MDIHDSSTSVTGTTIELVVLTLSHVTDSTVVTTNSIVVTTTGVEQSKLITLTQMISVLSSRRFDSFKIPFVFFLLCRHQDSSATFSPFTRTGIINHHNSIQTHSAAPNFHNS
jgi:hypothetical protein